LWLPEDTDRLITSLVTLKLSPFLKRLNIFLIGVLINQCHCNRRNLLIVDEFEEALNLHGIDINLFFDEWLIKKFKNGFLISLLNVELYQRSLNQ